MSTWSVSSKPISVEQLDEATQKEILRLKEQILKRQSEGGPRRGQNIPPEN
jgi:hypothetical protein